MLPSMKAVPAPGRRVIAETAPAFFQTPEWMVDLSPEA
jgi:hypothetical protein